VKKRDKDWAEPPGTNPRLKSPVSETKEAIADAGRSRGNFPFVFFLQYLQYNGFLFIILTALQELYHKEV